MLTLFGVAALSFMMLMYALERRGNTFVLAFAVGCALSSLYGFPLRRLALWHRRGALDGRRLASLRPGSWSCPQRPRPRIEPSLIEERGAPFPFNSAVDQRPRRHSPARPPFGFSSERAVAGIGSVDPERSAHRDVDGVPNDELPPRERQFVWRSSRLRETAGRARRTLPPTPPKRLKSCSMESHAPTGRARPWRKSFDGPTSRTESPVTFASTSTAT
jgi:hypothetical protein